MRVFHRLGDYKHKQRNRLKFLVRSLGWEGSRAEYERELLAFRAEGRRDIAVRSTRISSGRIGFRVAPHDREGAAGRFRLPHAPSRRP